MHWLVRLAMILAMSLASPAFALIVTTSEKISYVSTRSVVLYAEPDEKSKKLGTIPPYMVVQVTATGYRWMRINWKDDRAYVLRERSSSRPSLVSRARRKNVRATTRAAAGFA